MRWKGRRYDRQGMQTGNDTARTVQRKQAQDRHGHRHTKDNKTEARSDQSIRWWRQRTKEGGVEKRTNDNTGQRCERLGGCETMRLGVPSC